MAELEGQRVCVVLDDGSRIDDCQLVSGARRSARSLWLVVEGADLFVPLDRILEVWAAGDGAASRTPDQGVERCR